MFHMEISALPSRHRASVSAVLTLIVAVTTTGILAGVAPRLGTAFAPDAAVRTTRSGQRQPDGQLPHGSEHHGPPGGPASGRVDAAVGRAENATYAPPTPDAVVDAPAQPSPALREPPIPASALLTVRTGAAPRPGGRAPPSS